MRFLLALLGALLLLMTAALARVRADDDPLYLSMYFDANRAEYVLEILYTTEEMTTFNDRRYKFLRWIEDEMLLRCVQFMVCENRNILLTINGEVRPLLNYPQHNAATTIVTLDHTGHLALVRECAIFDCDPDPQNDNHYLYDFRTDTRHKLMGNIASVSYVGAGYFVYAGLPEPDHATPLYYADRNTQRLIYRVPRGASFRAPLAVHDPPAAWVYIEERAVGGVHTMPRLLRVNIHTNELQTLTDNITGLAFRYFHTEPDGDTLLMQANAHADFGTVYRLHADGTRTPLVNSVLMALDPLNHVLHDAANGQAFIIDTAGRLWHANSTHTVTQLAMVEKPLHLGHSPDGRAFVVTQQPSEQVVTLIDGATHAVSTHTLSEPPPGLVIPTSSPDFTYYIWDDDLLFRVTPEGLTVRWPNYGLVRSPDGQQVARVNEVLDTVEVFDAHGGGVLQVKPFSDDYYLDFETLNWTEHGILFRAAYKPGLRTEDFAYHLMTPDGATIRPIEEGGSNCAQVCTNGISPAFVSGQHHGLALGAAGVMGVLLAGGLFWRGRRWHSV